MVFESLLMPINAVHLLLIVFTLIICFVYQCVVKNWSYFSKRNLKFIRGVPIIGGYELFFGDKPFAVAFSDICDQFPDEQLFGMYMFSKPTYIIRDPDLIKRITITDFDYFLNHSLHIDVDMDALLARMLTFIRDQQWKEMRAILSPAFTGNKMRLMFGLVCESTNEFTETLNTLKCENNERYVDNDVELKDLFSRYATSIIATCAFGFKIDAVADRENEFFLSGKAISNFGGVQGLKMMVFNNIPKVAKLLQMSFYDPKLTNYFRNIITEAIEYREKNNILRPDMVHLLMQARKGTLIDGADADYVKKTNWVDDDIVAQCVLFFFAGFESMSTLLCFMGHELACNQDIQDRLYEEIIEAEQELNGELITYEALQKMKYLDMVVSESLRIWPPNASTDRQVTKTYNLKRNDGTVLQLQPGDRIRIPIFPLHRNAQFWPNPTRFDPERFNDENKQNIQPGTYLPFGIGPRNCLASRFALMVSKAVFYSILKEYRIEKCAKTQDPIELKPQSMNTHAKNGFWVRFRPRSSQN